MLSFLPQILFLAPFSALVLRIAVACIFFYIVIRIITSKNEVVGQVFPIIGRLPEWVIWFGSTITMIIAMMLFVGLLTQLVAIVGMVIAIKLFIFAPRLHPMLSLPRSTYAILFMICLSLLLTGAGVFAFDLPL